MKIALKYPDETFYNKSMIDGLGSALEKIDHEITYISASDDENKIANSIHGVDAFIQINNARTDTQQDFGCTFITWVQDVYSADSEMVFKKNRWRPNYKDQFYFLCDPNILGFELSSIAPHQNRGVLFTGLDPKHYLAPKLNEAESRKIDVGYIVGTPAVYDHLVEPNSSAEQIIMSSVLDLLLKVAPSSTFIRNLSVIYSRLIEGDTIRKKHTDLMSKVVREEYKPFTGSLDIKLISEKLKKAHPFRVMYSNTKPGAISFEKLEVFEQIIKSLANNHLQNRSWQAMVLETLKHRKAISSIETLNYFLQEKVDYFTQVYPRLIDRTFIANNIAEVTNNFSIWSNNDELKAFKPFYRGNLTSQKELKNAYQSCQMTIHSNNHGLSCHTRVLEALAHGTKVVIHSSGGRDLLPGGLSTLDEFQDGLIVCTPDNLKEKISEELEKCSNLEYRQKSSLRLKEIKKKLLAQHGWDQRAKNLTSSMLSDKVA
jgi:hypothetical protein